MCLQLQYVYLLSLAADWSTSLTSCEVQSGEKATWTPGGGGDGGREGGGKDNSKGDTSLPCTTAIGTHRE